jgi:hypothetical protein
MLYTVHTIIYSIYYHTHYTIILSPAPNTSLYTHIHIYTYTHIHIYTYTVDVTVLVNDGSKSYEAMTDDVLGCSAKVCTHIPIYLCTYVPIYLYLCLYLHLLTPIPTNHYLPPTTYHLPPTTHPLHPYLHPYRCVTMQKELISA